MTTTTRPSPRPIPDHGTSARYKGSRLRPPCRCARCTHGYNKDNQLRALRRAHGPLTVDTTPVADHIHTLVNTGLTLGQIARAARVEPSSVRHIASRRSPRTHRGNAEKILAVPAGTPPLGGPVPALGTIRRVRALYAIGQGPVAIAALTGLTWRNICNIAYGRYRTVNWRTRDLIADAYRQLALTPGTSTKARNRAIRENWASPLAWDDIDNPRARPRRTARAAAGHTVDHAAVMRALEGEPIELTAWENTAAIELGMRRGMSREDVIAALPRMSRDAVERSWARITARRRAAGEFVPDGQDAADGAVAS